MKVSLELLYHFQCDRCNKWWSIADFTWETGRSIFCPHCCRVHSLPEKPLTGKDFISE